MFKDFHLIEQTGKALNELEPILLYVNVLKEVQ